MPGSRGDKSPDCPDAFCRCCSLFRNVDAALLDAGLLAGKATEVVKFGATHLAILVDGDRVDERRFDGEDTLHTDVVAHFADGETLLVAVARDTDYHTAILLDTLFVTLFDAVGHGDGVAGTNSGCFLPVA